MKVTVLGLCRGVGKVYAKVKTSEPLDATALSIRLFANGAEFPANCYPFGVLDGFSKDDPRPFDQWVLEIPVLDFPSVKVGFFVDGEEAASMALSYRYAKWASRLNYRVRRDMCAEIRDYEENFLSQCCRVEPLRFLEGNEGDVWRVVVSWIGGAADRPCLKVFDGAGNALACKQHFFEFQRSAEDACSHKLFLSLELPRGQRSFYATAGLPGRKEGFCSIGPEQYEGFKRESWEYMKDARADDRAYGRWLRRHQASAEELEAQRSSVFEKTPLISIVVPCYESNSRFLREMAQSVLAQSYAQWELLLLDASPGLSTVGDVCKGFSDERIRYIDLGGNRGIVGNTNRGIEEARGDFVAFLDHDDLLEPDALFCYVERLNEQRDAKVFFCDEDLLDRRGRFVQPVFKTELNLDLLYSHNCVTHFLMVDKAYLLECGMSSDDVSGAQDYDLTLKVYEGGGRFCHVPRVLYHWRMHDGSTSGDAEGGKPYAEEAGRLALEQHFVRRSVSASVETTDHLFVYRVRYALPAPHPLVSIVIPNKDQREILEACVGSILDKATYDNYEIVVVENNSEQPETFECYDALKRKDGRVRVERWPGPFNYSAIVNYGARCAKGDYLLFLNNDTEVITPDFIEEMMGYLQRPEVGVVGAKLYFRDGLTQHAGMMVTSQGALAHVNQNFSREREGYLARAVRPGNFSGVTGACQMVRREVFDEVGGYDEAFAVGFNDADFCLRLIEAGYRVTFTPYAELYHYEFVSRGREVADAAKLERWEGERRRFAKCWKGIIENGDPFGNPNLDPDGLYYGLGQG